MKKDDLDHIIHLPEDIKDYKKGYYFEDETNRLVGRFNSHEEALENFKSYIKANKL